MAGTEALRMAGTEVSSVYEPLSLAGDEEAATRVQFVDPDARDQRPRWTFTPMWVTLGVASVVVLVMLPVYGAHKWGYLDLLKGKTHVSLRQMTQAAHATDGFEVIATQPCEGTGWLWAVSGQRDSTEACLASCKDSAKCKFVAFCSIHAPSRCTGSDANNCALYSSCDTFDSFYHGYTTYKVVQASATSTTMSSTTTAAVVESTLTPVSTTVTRRPTSTGTTSVTTSTAITKTTTSAARITSTSASPTATSTPTVTSTATTAVTISVTTSATVTSTSSVTPSATSTLTTSATATVTSTSSVTSTATTTVTSVSSVTSTATTTMTTGATTQTKTVFHFESTKADHVSVLKEGTTEGIQLRLATRATTDSVVLASKADLEKPSVDSKFQLVHGGTCIEKNKFPVTTLAFCRSAAVRLGLKSGDPKTADEYIGQGGCYVLDGVPWMPPEVPNVDAKIERPKAMAVCHVPLPGAIDILEADTDYPGSDFMSLKLPEVTDCNQKCMEIETCVSWSWRISGASSNCYLKDALPDDKAKKPTPGVISGSSMSSRAGMTPFGMLYCLTIVMPLGDQKNLLKLQYDKGTGIFACDMYSMYSSTSMEVVTGVYTVVLKQDVNCKQGPDFHTCVFIGMSQLIWRQVVDEKDYLQYKWTVKVNPDVVFLPDRLRRELNAYEGEAGTISFVNNCKFGLHGPLQVLSRSAVAVYTSVGSQCFKGHQFTLDTSFDEGQLLEYCLRTVLKLKKVDNYRLLSDKHCGAEDWQECSSDSVAFEPFKSTDLFGKCLATVSDTSPTRSA